MGRALSPKVIAAGAIGNVLEWYDFAIYGYFAAEIGRTFFSGSAYCQPHGVPRPLHLSRVLLRCELAAVRRRDRAGPCACDQ